MTYRYQKVNGGMLQMERNAKKNEQFLIMDLKKRINDKKYKQYLISCTDPGSRIVYNLVFDYMNISISPNRILLSQTSSNECADDQLQ